MKAHIAEKAVQFSEGQEKMERFSQEYLKNHLGLNIPQEQSQQRDRMEEDPNKELLIVLPPLKLEEYAGS